MKKMVLALTAVSLIAFTSCKKKGEEEAEAQKVGGCTDSDSPFYKSGLNFDDGSCKYAKVTEVQVVNFPEKDNGSSWDWPSGDADLYVQLKPVAEADYTNFFSSKGNEITNAVFNSVNPWVTAVQFQLTNADWYYEVMDHDATSADDVVATGTFNPLNGDINTTTNELIINHANGTQLLLKLLIE